MPGGRSPERSVSMFKSPGPSRQPRPRGTRAEALAVPTFGARPAPADCPGGQSGRLAEISGFLGKKNSRSHRWASFVLFLFEGFRSEGPGRLSPLVPLGKKKFALRPLFFGEHQGFVFAGRGKGVDFFGGPAGNKADNPRQSPTKPGFPASRANFFNHLQRKLIFAH